MQNPKPFPRIQARRAGLSLLCTLMLALGSAPLLACGDDDSMGDRMDEAMEEVEDEAKDAKEDIEDEIDDHS
jgi:hypothetical protein